MSHATETARLWAQLGEAEEVYVKWSAFFRLMAGRPHVAAALCELGLRVVRGEQIAGVSLRGSVERILGIKQRTWDRATPATLHAPARDVDTARPQRRG